MISRFINGVKHHISPWMTIGTSLVLIAVVSIQTAMNYNREKIYMSQILKEKGAALINAFEAGVKTGMTGMFGNDARLQTLLEETSSQPDIAYIAIVNKKGAILAHNDRHLIGTQYQHLNLKKNLLSSNKSQWRVVKTDNGTTYFEVFKSFLPDLKKMYSTSHSGMMLEKTADKADLKNLCPPAWMKGMDQSQILNFENRPFIFIGMDVQPFKNAMAEDLYHTIIMISIIVSLGLAGVISLFWAQNYTLSRKLLKDTRAFASEIVTNIPVGIIAIDTNHMVTYMNHVACTLLKTDYVDQKPLHAKTILPEDILELYDLVKKGQDIVEKELKFVSVKNNIIPVAVSATNMMGEKGNLIGFMFVLKDLSEIQALKAQSKHNEKLAAIGNLAAGIAHEIRNPLSSIKGYVTFFGSLFDKGSENQKAADLMAEEVDRVNRVISELLEFARPTDLKLKDMEASSLIDHSIRIVAHEAKTSGIDIIKKIDPGLPAVYADIDRLTQVLLNFYINAIQAMKHGGKLTVQVKSKNSHVIIIVSDTGKGISTEDLENIFNPYFTTKKNGTGLGLAIAHKIVENHQGLIQVTSKENSGTTFTIYLPFKNKKDIKS